MIRFLTGSLFDSDAATLVNPVNCVGVSGAGLAKEFKKRFPADVRCYERVCREGAPIVGRFVPGQLFWQGSICFFPTKEHWRDPSELDFIEMGLGTFVDTYGEFCGPSVAFPALGCGNGGLDWEDVKPLMERYLKLVRIPVSVYLPHPARKRASV